MLVVGARGFAKELLEVIHQLSLLENLVFYDDLNKDVPDKLYGKFPVLKSLSEASSYFEKIDKRFTLGIGNPSFRNKMFEKFSKEGGDFCSTISPLAHIPSYDIEIGVGSNILAGATFSNGVTLGKGCLVYYNSIITHDCKVGDFAEISPGAVLLGKCIVGNYTHIGAGATILPGVKIGKNVIVGAGSVVTKDVPDGCVVMGVPAKFVKEIPPVE